MAPKRKYVKDMPHNGDLQILSEAANDLDNRLTPVPALVAQVNDLQERVARLERFIAEIRSKKSNL